MAPPCSEISFQTVVRCAASTSSVHTAANRLAASVEHFKAAVDASAAIGKHNPTLDRASA
jgi:hypothetical protein